MGPGRGSDERTPFLVEVAALRRAPGTSRRVCFEAPLSGLSVPSAAVDEGAPVHVDVLLESVSGGILVSGTVRARWSGSCRRCLEAAHGELCVELAELCVDHPDDEDTTYGMSGDVLDLAPIVRDACILELPLAPLCSEGCLGLCPGCGVNRNVERCACAPPADPRWAALAALPSEGERPEELTQAMAVPKKKTSKSKSRSRRAANWVLEAPAKSRCPQCGRAKVPHVVCPHCGWYKGRQAVEVD